MAQAEPPPGRDRRAQRHQATREEIVQTAWGLSRERGLAGWSLRDVAAVVGMRAPSLYVYFDSKLALYDAMFADGYRVMLDRIDTVPLDPDPVLMVHRAARMFYEFAVEDPARYYLLFVRTLPGFEPSPPSFELAIRAQELLVGVLRAAGARDDMDVDLFTALMSGLATQQVSNDPGGDRWGRLLDDTVDVYLAAVAAPKRSGRRQ